MNRGIRIIAYVVLAVIALLSTERFKRTYDHLVEAGSDRHHHPALEEDAGPAETAESDPAPVRYRLGLWGAGLLISVVSLGFLLARDIAAFLASRTMKALFSEHGEGIVTPDYEKAEDLWNTGDFLGAVQLMREYLQENPREQHVALRIAEIYEKDLNNYLAAALEYEEVLTQKLPPERWGWAAIHLCNLYTGRMNQPEKAVALLRRIDAEYGDTAAAEKARARLAQLESEGLIPAAQPPEPAVAEAPARPTLPPGFSPKKS